LRRRGRRALRTRRAALSAEFLESVIGVFLAAPDLLLELLITELQLLDRPRELPDLVLQAVKPHRQLGGGHLSDDRRWSFGTASVAWTIFHAIASPKDSAERAADVVLERLETAGLLRIALSRGRAADHKRSGSQQGKGSTVESASGKQGHGRVLRGILPAQV
jgi:hypothetical protein